MAFLGAYFNCLTSNIFSVGEISSTGGALTEQQRIRMLKLLGLTLLMNLGPHKQSDGAHPFPEMELQAWDLLGFEGKSKDYKNAAEKGYEWMPMTNSGTKMEALRAVGNGLKCIVDVGLSIVTLGHSGMSAREHVYNAGSSLIFERSRERIEEPQLERRFGGCIALLTQVATFVAGQQGWNRDEAWRVKGLVDTQKLALKELDDIKGKLQNGGSRATLLALKQITCTGTYAASSLLRTKTYAAPALGQPSSVG